MRIVAHQTLNGIEQDIDISYVSVPTSMLKTACITSSDELNVELLPIETDTDDPNTKLAFGIIITKKEV
jgi:hypothetical protein